LRTIVARALQTNATGLIAAHNHPSGAAEPSEADRLFTRDLLTAARPLGLRVLDRVIVAEESTDSFADSGLLDELVLEFGKEQAVLSDLQSSLQKRLRNWASPRADVSLTWLVGVTVKRRKNALTCPCFAAPDCLSK
jgi:hypothetical protein